MGRQLLLMDVWNDKEIMKKISMVISCNWSKRKELVIEVLDKNYPNEGDLSKKFENEISKLVGLNML